MFNISSFLNKLSKEINNSEVKRFDILRIIKDVSNIEIDINNIEVRDYIVYIKATPSIKNALFINKQRIIDKTRESKINISDIK